MLGVSSPAGEFPTQFALIQLGTNTRDPEFLVLSGKDCAADAVHRIRSQPLLRESAQKEKSCAKQGITSLKKLANYNIHINNYRISQEVRPHHALYSFGLCYPAVVSSNSTKNNSNQEMSGASYTEFLNQT